MPQWVTLTFSFPRSLLQGPPPSRWRWQRCVGNRKEAGCPWGQIKGNFTRQYKEISPFFPFIFPFFFKYYFFLPPLFKKSSFSNKRWIPIAPCWLLSWQRWSLPGQPRGVPAGSAPACAVAFQPQREGLSLQSPTAGIEQRFQEEAGCF